MTTVNTVSHICTYETVSGKFQTAIQAAKKNTNQYPVHTVGYLEHLNQLEGSEPC